MNAMVPYHLKTQLHVRCIFYWLIRILVICKHGAIVNFTTLCLIILHVL